MAPHPGVAPAVASEIRRKGGEAIASDEPVGSVAAGEAIVRSALDAFGRLDVLAPADTRWTVDEVARRIGEMLRPNP